MSLACETEVGVKNDCALRFSIVLKPCPVLEYIKTISSLVGACHVLAVFEEHDSLKVFFDDKRFVDILIKSGIHILGRHIRVDYVVPPGTKIILSDVDPVISNFDLLRLLSVYGTVVSPIIRPPLCDDAEFCHIGYGVRYVYMALNGTIPSKVEFRYGEQLCLLRIKTCENASLTFVKRDDSEVTNEVLTTYTHYENDCAGPSNVDIYTFSESMDPVVVSVESNASETNSDDQVVAFKGASVKKTRRPRERLPPKSLRIKPTKITATSRAAKRIKQNIKHKWITSKRKPLKKGTKRGGRSIRQVKKQRYSNSTLPSTSSPTNSSSSTPPLLISEFKYKSSSGSILSDEDFQSFCDECKHNRAPIEVARKYLGNDCTDDMINRLIKQLNEFKSALTNPSLKIRVRRLIKTLTDTK